MSVCKLVVSLSLLLLIDCCWTCDSQVLSSAEAFGATCCQLDIRAHPIQFIYWLLFHLFSLFFVVIILFSSYISLSIFFDKLIEGPSNHLEMCKWIWLEIISGCWPNFPGQSLLISARFVAVIILYCASLNLRKKLGSDTMLFWGVEGLSTAI